MKKIICLTALICAASLSAQEPPSQEDVARIVAAVEAATGWTVDELTGGLEMLNHVWREDMKTPEGRKRWNGEVVSVDIDTNTLTKTTIYTNGYAHVERFKTVAAMGLQDRLTAAERQAMAEAAAKAKAAADEKRKADRIAALETNLVAETNALMKRNKWPEELARLYLLNELNQLKTKVEVNAVVSPKE